MTVDLREYKARDSAEQESGQPVPGGGRPEPAEGQRPGSGVPEDWVSQITLEDARRIYVKRGYDRFAAAFARCDEAGGMRISLAVAPFFLGWLWFFYRKMYVEGLAILAGNFVLSFVVGFFSFTDRAYFMVGMIVGLTLTMFGKGLYWKAVDRQIARAMTLFPQNPRQALEWLDARGGVNLWIVLAVLALFGLFVFMMVAGQVRSGRL